MAARKHSSSAGRSAVIDMALWAAQAKAVGRPLARLLGSEATHVAAYASLPKMGLPAEDAEEAREAGFRALKVRSDAGDLDADLAVIRAVRTVVGEDCELMVDYNQALKVSEAIERIRALDAEKPIWVEEQTHADDYAGHVRSLRP